MYAKYQANILIGWLIWSVVLPNVIANSTQFCEYFNSVRSKTQVMVQERGMYDYYDNWVSEVSFTYYQRMDSSRHVYRLVPVYPWLYSVSCQHVKTGENISAVELPKHFEGAYVHCLMIFESSITEVSVPMFMNFPNITTLMLNGNNIDTIQIGSFEKLSQMEELHLENNKMKVINSGLLNPMKNLKILDVSSNLLEEIDENSFNGLTNLEKIVLNSNRLTHLPESIFTSQELLKNIDLSGNCIKLIQLATFDKLFKMEELYLQNNKLKVIASGLLKSMKNLKILDVSSNLLEHIEENSFNGLNNLEKIILNSNRLTHLSEKMFVSQEHLKHLDLSGNNFKLPLPKMIFSNLTELGALLLNDCNLQVFQSYPKTVVNLSLNNNSISFVSILEKYTKYINFGRNNITQLNFSLPLLSVEINLGYNMITRIEKRSFSGLSNLVKLNLEHNHIEFLQVGIFNDLHSLSHLDLSNNFLSNINFGLFYGLQNLWLLNLNSNKLKNLQAQVFYPLIKVGELDVSCNELSTAAVEEIIDYLKNLRRINIANNSFTCSSLLKLIKKIESAKIYIIEQNVLDDTNVQGIACKQYFFHQQRNVSNEIQNNTSSAPVVNSYDIQQTLRNFSEQVRNVEQKYDVLLNTFISKSEDINNAIFNLTIKMNAEFYGFSKTLPLEIDKNEYTHTVVLYALLILFFVLFATIAVLLYKFYIRYTKQTSIKQTSIQL